MPYLTSRKGQRWGDLKVLNETGLEGRGDRRWHCECACGHTRVVAERRLITGKITECIKCEVRRKMNKFIEGQILYER